jgi:hypothetical protein
LLCFGAGLWWVADIFAGEEARNQFLLAHQKTSTQYHCIHQNLTSFYRPTLVDNPNERPRGRMRRRVAVGQVADDAMLEKGQHEVSSFLVLVKWRFDNDMNENSPSNCSRH